MTNADELFLRAAVELAEGGRFTCAPNPPVGCVIAKGHEVLGRGFHKRAGKGHAEVEAIKDAGGNAVANYDSVADYASAGRMVKQCVDTFGKIDILVNVAGMLRERGIIS